MPFPAWWKRLLLSQTFRAPVACYLQALLIQLQHTELRGRCRVQGPSDDTDSHI